MRITRHIGFASSFALLLAAGCAKPPPEGAIVVTQVPAAAQAPAAGGSTQLDVRYPAGSRVVVQWPPFGPGDIRVLSKGLHAAGEPVLSSDARRVLFVAKATPSSSWQIYDSDLSGGGAAMLTDAPGGAMDPALLKDGRLVFASPVPLVPPAQSSARPPQLHVKSAADGRVERLTFAPGGAFDPVVLRDGRILFVSRLADGAAGRGPRSGLFTINNDGTEFTAFSGQDDDSGWLRRPRAFGDGRLGFLREGPTGASVAEAVSFARPHQGRVQLANPATSVEPAGGKKALVCASPATGAKASGPETVFVLDLASRALEPLCASAGWRLVEAVTLTPTIPPMGRASAMNPSKNSGLILCLDANRSSQPANNGLTGPAVRLRVTTLGPSGREQFIGEAPIEADGSFSAEVPTDIPLGFETLDSQGRVLRRQAPMPWVRAGENRSCVGCHEPRNHSPRNARPLAVDHPPENLVHPGLNSVASSRPLP